jgi:hypothetical protein
MPAVQGKPEAKLPALLTHNFLLNDRELSPDAVIFRSHPRVPKKDTTTHTMSIGTATTAPDHPPLATLLFTVAGFLLPAVGANTHEPEIRPSLRAVSCMR